MIGFSKGKSVIPIYRKFGNKRLTGLLFLTRGYGVSSAGLDETAVRKYHREQEKADK